jgi:anti-anti-sigma factor
MSDLASFSLRHGGDVVVAAVAGEIDISNADGLERAISEEVSNDAAGLVVDLAGLSFMDSSGVHMLFALADRLRYRDQRFALVLPDTSPPRRVLELSGPEAMAWIHDTEEAAIEAVRAGC